MAGPGRPRKNQQQAQQTQAQPAADQVQQADADAIEVKAYIPRPELAAAGQDARRSGEELRHKQATGRQRTPPELGIECKNCRSLFIETTHTNPKMGVIRRRRRCLKCGFAWYTVEAPEIQDTNITNSDAM